MAKWIIFGAGSTCKELLEKENILKNIVVLLDNDKNKWGKTINGKEIVRPDKVNDYEFDKIIIVSDSYKRIFKQLTFNYNIAEDKIIFFEKFNWENSVHYTPKNTGTIDVDWSKVTSDEALYEQLCKNPEKLGDAERFFLLGEHNHCFKWLCYFDVYERHFQKYRNKEITIMEIGVNKGGSLQLWKNYFGDKAKVIGIDINPECKKLEEENIEIYIGSQADREFLKEIKSKVPKLDILIDDGSHQVDHQRITFEEMFDHIADDGVYLCEDVHTSYSYTYNSDYKDENSFVEYSKNFIDYINAWHSHNENLKVNKYTKHMHSVHYYPSCIVVEKKRMYRPFDLEVTNTGGERKIVFHMRRYEILED